MQPFKVEPVLSINTTLSQNLRPIATFYRAQYNLVLRLISVISTFRGFWTPTSDFCLLEKKVCFVAVDYPSSLKIHERSGVGQRKRQCRLFHLLSSDYVKLWCWTTGKRSIFCAFVKYEGFVRYLNLLTGTLFYCLLQDWRQLSCNTVKSLVLLYQVFRIMWISQKRTVAPPPRLHIYPAHVIMYI